MQIAHPRLIDANYSDALALSGSDAKVVSGLNKSNAVGEWVDSTGGLQAVSKKVDDIYTFLSAHEELEGITSTVDKFISFGSQVASVSDKSCIELVMVIMCLTTVNRSTHFSRWLGT